MSTISQINPSAHPTADFGLYRSTLNTISLVTAERISFTAQQEDVAATNLVPYTIFHPLRPFLGLGYGRSCHLRGSGVGKGDDVDSGSYTFLQGQAKYML
jgi:regulator-associated protein of mTOR